MDEEAELARLLAQNVSDEALWDWMTSSDTHAREALLRRAIRLYRRTWPLIDARPDDSPRAAALSLVREIAALAAHRSRAWTEKDRAEFGFTELDDPRKVFELWIRLYDVHDWAAGLGYPLAISREPIGSTDIPEGVWREPVASVDDRAIAEQVSRLLGIYAGVVATRHDPRMVRHLTSEESRRGRTALVSHSRGVLIYGRGHLPTEAQPALAAYVLAADALFVASYEPEGDLFPTEEYLRWLLNPEAREWLRGHGFELPETIRDE